MSAGPSAVELRAVSVRYGDHVAVDRADLVAPAGVITALVGPSGSGKSSLLFAVNRLHDLDRSVTVTGDLRLGALDLAKAPGDALRTRIGLVFQRPAPFPMSILENVTFALRAHGAPRSELPGRAEHALRRAALWDEVQDRLTRPAASLSGGQQQRLCLARALALEPEALLLDEPCSALDPRSTALIEDTLLGLRGSTTVLLVTHNLAQARRVASRCVCLWPAPGGGRVTDAGPIDRVFEAPATRELADYFRGATG